jgi:glucan 1,3-beta-glucosidase
MGTDPRLKVGYYHLCGPEPRVIQNTDFAPYQNVFEGAWNFIDRAISTAAKYNIGVFVGKYLPLPTQPSL